MAYTHDLIVIGAGSAGLTAAGGAAMFGLKVALIEAGEMGGECLNTGCVPSKALLAAAARAQAGRRGKQLGVGLDEPAIEWSAVMRHVRGAITDLAPHDSQERFEAMGVEVIRARAEFLPSGKLRVGNRELAAPRHVLAVGSRPAIPPIDGLDAVPYLTNETLFDLEKRPDHLLVIGGGAVGMEMAQAFRRLGSGVTVFHRSRPLGREDEEAVKILVAQLEQEGVCLVRGSAERVEKSGERLMLHCSDGSTHTGSHLLIATGRQAAVEDLALENVKVDVGDDGITVDSRRRTSNRRIYAIGDCRTGPRLTHAAGHEGSEVALEVALGWPASVNFSALPRCIYTDPEVAQIGLTEEDARERHEGVRVLREDFGENDRAVTSGDTRGFLKLVMKGRRVLGVTIVGAHAGEMLLPWTQVMAGKASTFGLASAIVAYPTRSEIAQSASFSAWERVVFGSWSRRWAAALAKGRKWLA